MVLRTRASAALLFPDMTTNPIILKLIECLAYTIEEDESDELEFNLEINGASLEEEDEDDEDDEDWDVAELSDFE